MLTLARGPEGGKRDTTPFISLSRLLVALGRDE